MRSKTSSISLSIKEKHPEKIINFLFSSFIGYKEDYLNSVLEIGVFRISQNFYQK